MNKYFFHLGLFALSIGTQTLFGMDTHTSSNATQDTTNIPSTGPLNLEGAIDTQQNITTVFNITMFNKQKNWDALFYQLLLAALPLQTLAAQPLQTLFDAKNKDGLTPLLFALTNKKWISANYLSNLRLTWAKHTLPNKTNALMVAAQNMNEEQVGLVIRIFDQGKFSRITKNTDQKTAYDFACENPTASDAIKIFLSVDVPSKSLFKLLKSGHPITTQALKKLFLDGAQLTYIENNHTVIEYALALKRYDAINIILKNLPKRFLNTPLAEGKTALGFAIEYHKQLVFSLDEIKTLITPENINHKDYNGWTPLHLATQFHPEAIPLLLATPGIDVNCKITYSDWTPLHMAAQYHPEAIPLLLKKQGINLNCKTNNGLTPLHLATQFHPKAIPLLLATPGIDVNCTDNTGYTPLHTAAVYNPKVVPLLLAAPGIDVNCKTTKGWAPLHYAVRHNSKSVSLLLAVPGIDDSCQPNDGKTAFEFLAEKTASLIREANWTSLKRILLEFSTCPAMLNAPLTDGKTALEIAITYNKQLAFSLDEIEKLITPENINHTSGIMRWTPIYIAANAKQIDIVDALIQKRCDPLIGIGAMHDYLLKIKIKRGKARDRLIKYRQNYKQHINNSPSAPPKNVADSQKNNEEPSAPEKIDSNSDTDSDYDTSTSVTETDIS